MTGSRRELPPSKVAGHRPGPAPHRAFEGSPCGRAHPLLEDERPLSSTSSEWLVGRERPHEPGELAGAGDHPDCADSPELLNALRARASRGSCTFTLLAPKKGADRLPAEIALDSALIRMRDAGLAVDGVVGDSDPLVAVQETWDPCRFDEVVVSTLPTHSSRWLGIDLPHRVANFTGASVAHVVAISHELVAR
jgi:hypothetical protein